MTPSEEPLRGTKKRTIWLYLFVEDEYISSRHLDGWEEHDEGKEKLWNSTVMGCGLSREVYVIEAVPALSLPAVKRYSSNAIHCVQCVRQKHIQIMN